MGSDLTRRIRAARVGDRQIITPRLNSYLGKHPDIVYDDWVADRIRDILKAPQRDRSASFSSSASGTCPRAQMFGFKGIPTGVSHGTQLINIFNDGRWRHLRWQAMLLQAGILSDIEVFLDWPAKLSKGSMDGTGIVPDDHDNEQWRGLEYGFELKGMNTWGFQNAVKYDRVKEEHLSQIDGYFLSGGLDLFVVIYEDKNTQEWHEWVVEPDPARLSVRQAELDALNEYARRKELPPMLPGCKTGKGAEWKRCDYAGKNGVCVSRRKW